MAAERIEGSGAGEIAASIESAIRTGRLGAGELLPTVRALAEATGVSPATAAAAYRIVRDRGLVVADGRRGTRVRRTGPVAGRQLDSVPQGARNLADGNPDRALLPDLSATLAVLDSKPRLYGHELNDPRLLRLAAHQFDLDSVPSSAISITSGALDGVERVLREHSRPGDRILVEDPCFPGVLDLLAALALTPVPVPVDDEGLLPAALRSALTASVSALVITPRAQNPTGAALSERRARQLRAALRLKPEVLLIEDDHAGPVAGAPYVTLVEASREKWAVVRSVSKSLGPDLRVAVMASDSRTRERIEGGQTVGIRWVSHILQEMVFRLWSDGEVRKQLASAGRVYTERRAALVGALRAHGIASHGSSGLNVWIPVPEEVSVARGLLGAGWAVAAGERYRIRSEPAIRVTIATLSTDDAVRFAADFARLVRSRPGGSGV